MTFSTIYPAWLRNWTQGRVFRKFSCWRNLSYPAPPKFSLLVCRQRYLLWKEGSRLVLRMVKILLFLNLIAALLDYSIEEICRILRIKGKVEPLSLMIKLIQLLNPFSLIVFFVCFRLIWSSRRNATIEPFLCTTWQSRSVSIQFCWATDLQLYSKENGMEHLCQDFLNLKTVWTSELFRCRFCGLYFRLAFVILAWSWT